MSEGIEALIARVDERTALMIDNQNRLEHWMKTQDERICSLEACRNHDRGYNAAVSVVSSFLIGVGTLAVSLDSVVVK